MITAIDQQPLALTLPPVIRQQTELMIECRADPILFKLVEGLVISRVTGSAAALTEPVALSYVRRWAGDDGVERYLATLRDEARVLEVARLVQGADWKLSPLTTALTLGQERNQPFDPAPHLRLVSDAVVDGVSGRGKRFLVISMPPRHGKSTLTSRRSTAWLLANYPDRFVGVAGYSDDFAATWGRVCRNDVMDHAERFGFGVAQDSSAASSWHDTLEGGMWTAGVGGSVTGKGASLLILDDVVKNAAEARSLTEREALWSWWTSTARTRLANGGLAVIVMTRWHSEDIAGRVLSQPDADEWAEIKLPALWESDQPDAIGRTRGQVLWPGMFGPEEMAKTRAAVGAEDWAALYQGTPLDETTVNKAYKFDADAHLREVYLDPACEVRVGVDFNVSPMSVVIGQVREIVDDPLWRIITNHRLYLLEVVDELSLDDSTTSEAADELVERLRRLGRGRKLKLLVTGDASGNQRRTSSGMVPKTDWAIFKEVMRRHASMLTVTYDVRSSNPGVRDRVNKLNSFLRSADGVTRFAVDPRCRVLIEDLKKVTWARDASGNVRDTLSKKDPRLTHASDALGYLAWIVGNDQQAGELPYSPR